VSAYWRGGQTRYIAVQIDPPADNRQLFRRSFAQRMASGPRASRFTSSIPGKLRWFAYSFFRIPLSVLSGSPQSFSIVDAQLPPALARLLREVGGDAFAVREIGLRDAQRCRNLAIIQATGNGKDSGPRPIPKKRSPKKSRSTLNPGHARSGFAAAELSGFTSPTARRFAHRPRCVRHFRHRSTFEAESLTRRPPPGVSAEGIGQKNTKTEGGGNGSVDLRVGERGIFVNLPILSR
jgi:hypothetical protein